MRMFKIMAKLLTGSRKRLLKLSGGGLQAPFYIDKTTRVYISGKVTHSILTLLAKQSIDIDPLYEYTELPAEFLRDPSCWLEAPKVEAFLVYLEKKFAGLYLSLIHI